MPAARSINLLLVLLLASLADSENYGLGALRWRNIGPNRGGRSLAVAGSRSRRNEYYFGATGGGLWKTTDGGASWKPVTDGQITSSSVGAVAVADSNPDIVYLGMGETELRGSILQGDGIYKSVDAGKTWRKSGLADTQAVSRIRIHPRNPDLIYVAALGHPYGPNEQRGVFRSTDGGKTWRRILYRSDRAGAVDLCLDPNHPEVLYASLWDVYRTPWLLSSGGPGSGLFKSTDGGDTWTDISRNKGLPSGILGKICVSVSAADSNRVYATVEAEDGGVYRSDDAGATWMRVNEERKIRQRAFYFTRTYADPRDRDTLYVLNVEFYKSADGGKTFAPLKARHSDHHDLWIAPDDRQRMIEANDGGGSVSVNGGESWTAEEFPTAQFYHVAVTADVPYHVCGCQQDSGTACVSSALRSSDPEAPTKELLYSVGGGEDGYIAANAANPNIFYAGTQAGMLTRFDRATGQLRDITVDPWFFSGMPAKDLRERWQWVVPLVLSPVDSHILFASSQHLWKTVNEGRSWQRISPDLTRADPKTLGDSGGPITKDQNGPEIYGTIYTVAPSRHDVNTIWAGTDDGLVWITRDGGARWAKITPPSLPEFSRISLIDASPHNAAAAYLAAKRYELDDRRPYVYRTSDYGKTWSKIVNGIRDDDFVNVVREDSQRPGLLYAGTDHGAYVSFDNGTDWQSLSLNLPDVPVVDLLVQEDDLVIATHGRSFYVLDNAGPLRQVSPEVTRSAIYVFKPQAAIRSLRNATIDYYLQEPAERASVQILSPGGQVVREFDCKSCKAGMHRIAWDLRYPGAATFPGLILRAVNAEVGPVAPPGRYQVRVTANGRIVSQALSLERDTRLADVTDEDLTEQFKLATQLRDATSDANRIVIRIREIKAQLKDRPHDGELGKAISELDQKLSAIEEEIYQVKNRSPRDTLNFPIKLNNQLAMLARLVDTGDSRPTEQSYRVFRELSERLGGLKMRLSQALETDLSAVNKLLVNQKLSQIH
ncbi:MAG: glycosyl hydrolase [Acidobacteria bacterium]|nr:MAG: glycosyl hydrolase [Acidobacteriota bacterium]